MEQIQSLENIAAGYMKKGKIVEVKVNDSLRRTGHRQDWIGSITGISGQAITLTNFFNHSSKISFKNINDIVTITKVK
ncbi:hypothetical protein [Lentilactobacillus sp. Marseille-Q4993]|uniref:hypothetical protein n=1 Tax=Lentilactobacillus sp. Marseille-Q4993 TaxID=3039492 RepID=UPI0024BC8F8C|nr:hypothetical protein [Lentilactobacillus sp. Marseille-Q4993]